MFNKCFRTRGGLFLELRLWPPAPPPLVRRPRGGSRPAPRPRPLPRSQPPAPKAPFVVGSSPRTVICWVFRVEDRPGSSRQNFCNLPELSPVLQIADYLVSSVLGIIRTSKLRLLSKRKMFTFRGRKYFEPVCHNCFFKKQKLWTLIPKRKQMIFLEELAICKHFGNKLCFYFSLSVFA